MQLNVVYCSNENYIQHAAASIYSLLESNRSFSAIHISVIDFGISEKSKAALQSLAASFSRVIAFYPVGDFTSKLPVAPGFTISLYGRLFLTDFLNEDKVLYLDCDTIVCEDLTDLWSQDISAYSLAAVQDVPANYLLTSVGMRKSDRYFNSGVMLINLKKWREANLEMKFLEFFKQYEGFVPHHDQGILNGVCCGQVLFLDPKYNMMPEMIYMTVTKVKHLYGIGTYYSQDEIDQAVFHPTVIHYIEKFYDRPWYKNCSHPLKDRYLDCLHKSGFDFQLNDHQLKLQIRIQKWIFKHLPFPFFVISEKILDLRRILLIRLRSPLIYKKY